MKISSICLALTTSLLTVLVYHFFFVQEKLTEFSRQPGYYVLDVKKLTTIKATEIAMSVARGEISMPDQQALLTDFSIFNDNLRTALDELVGRAIVFLPNTVVNVEHFVDITPQIAEMMNINLDSDVTSLLSNKNSQNSLAPFQLNSPQIMPDETAPSNQTAFDLHYENNVEN